MTTMMRRRRIWAVWLLLAAELAWLGAASRGQVQPVVALDLGPGPHARSVQTSEGVSFYLENHDPRLLPSLTVAARDRLDESLHYSAPRSGTTVVTLPRRHLESYPAQLLEYAWSVGTTELPGRHLYVNPDYPYDWEVQHAKPLTVYYTGAYPAYQVEGWAEIYRWLAGFLLMQNPPTQTIYLMPSVADLRRAVDLNPSDERRLSGLWVERAESILLAPQSEAVLTTTVAHEFTHALLYNRNPIWWEEGIATWIAYQEAAHRIPGARSAGWQAFEVAMQALHRLALESEISLDQIDQTQTYPLDRYTIGISFVLYVRSRLGEPGVLLLAVSAATQPLDEAVQEVLGETLSQVKQHWLTYLRSRRFLEDAATP